MKKLEKALIVRLFGHKKPCPNFDFCNVRSVLIQPLGTAVGDAVINTAYAAQIKKMYPQAHIGIFVTPRNREILSHCPAVDELVESRWPSYFRQHKKWDLFLDFNEVFTTRELVKNKILSPRATMIFKKERKPYYHLDNIKNYDFYCPFSPREHVSRHLNTSEFAKHHTVPAPEICFEFAEEEKQQAAPFWQANGKIKVFVAPQGSVPFKAIAPRDLAALLNKLAPELRPHVQFLLCRTKTAEAFFTELSGLLDADIDIRLSAPTTLQQYIAVTASADLVISVDSGTAHLACAAKRPLLSFYVEHNINTWSPLHRADVPHFMMIAKTDTTPPADKNIHPEHQSWLCRQDFPIQDGADWLNTQLRSLLPDSATNPTPAP